MRLGLGIGIDKSNIAAISGGLSAKFLGTGTQYAQLAPITRQLSAAMTGEGSQATDLLVTKRFTPNYTGDGTMSASLASYDFLLSGDGVAAAAYSLRALNPDYTGALVLIRRSSDNAEKAFYPDANNVLSMSSEDGASTSLSTWIGSDNGFVKIWYDQSGSATVRDATQTTTSRQPQIISSGALLTSNGKPNLDFSSGKYMVIPDASVVATDLSFLFTRTITSYPSSYKTGFNYKRTGITYNSNGGGSFGNGAHLYKDAATSKSDDYPQTTGQAVDFIYNKANLERNGAAATLVSGSGYGVGSGSIGSYQGTTQTFDNEIQEFVVFESDENTNKSTLVDNVNGFYSIY